MCRKYFKISYTFTCTSLYYKSSKIYNAEIFLHILRYRTRPRFSPYESTQIAEPIRQETLLFVPVNIEEGTGGGFARSDKRISIIEVENARWKEFYFASRYRRFCVSYFPRAFATDQIQWIDALQIYVFRVIYSIPADFPFVQRTCRSFWNNCLCTNLSGYIGLATKWLRILSIGGIDKIRNHLVAKPIS